MSDLAFADVVRRAHRYGVSGRAWELHATMQMARRLPRITVPLVSHFDWDRLRVNVFHHVAPELVKWK